MTEITLFVVLFLHQSHSQAASCVENFESTSNAIEIPVEMISGHRQPVVMLETLDLSR